MLVREIMTEDPVCCPPDASIQDVARLMDENDCGEIPVVNQYRQPVGVITDRDICCRAVAQGKDASSTTAEEVMSPDVVTVTPEDSVEWCSDLMEDHQIRRIPVVDEEGACCGMVSQADIALAANDGRIAELLRDVSRPHSGNSRVSH